MTPVTFSFSELTLIDFNDCSLSSNHFGFAFDEVQYDFSVKLKPVIRSVLIWCSFWIAFDCTFCIMSYVTNIVSSKVSLLLGDHEECLRLRVALHRSLCFPSRTSIDICLWRSHFSRGAMLLSHVGQDISLFNSPHSCKNFTPFSWSENKNPPKKHFGRKTISPPLHCARRIPSGRKASSSFRPGKPWLPLRKKAPCYPYESSTTVLESV
jgi:hypothetical protein